MTAAELRKIERDLSDENSLLRTSNARLRAELSRATQAWGTCKHNETRLRAEFITLARHLHSTELHAGHGQGTMSECLHSTCKLATKELAG